MKNIMNRRVVGAVYTVELLICLMLFVMMWNLIISTLVMFNHQRFINTIFTSTLINMAKWGGNENNLTRLNGVGDLIQSAQMELNRVLSNSGTVSNIVISGSPKKVTEGNEVVSCSLTCEFGYQVMGNKDWTMIYKKSNFTVKMNSLVKPGSLL